MNKQSKGLITTLAISLSAPALAQQADEPTETIVVTGSRIARTSDFGNSSPVDIIDRASIEKAGFANLQQLMEKMPANGNGAFSTRGNNQDSTANGAASISLRGLGADATLVLVNGRRVAVSAFAESITTNFVDINSIPVSAIERVEVLKDGASAVYGSDAVAGVVNIILRKDFEGLELSGSLRQHHRERLRRAELLRGLGIRWRRQQRHVHLRLLQEQHPGQRRTRHAGHREPDGAGRRRLPFLAWLSGPLLRERHGHTSIRRARRAASPGRPACTTSDPGTCSFRKPSAAAS